MTALSVRASVAPSDGARLDPRLASSERTDMTGDKIHLELLPHERAVLLKWNFTPEVREQLEASASSADVVTLRLSSVAIRWLASDLTHAIVKLGCDDQDAFELSERLDYVEQTGDGSLEAWY